MVFHHHVNSRVSYQDIILKTSGVASKVTVLVSLNNLFSHPFNIEFNKDKHDYNTRCKNNIRKSTSSRNWGHWTVTNFASNDWNKLDLSIRQNPSLVSFKRALRNEIVFSLIFIYSYFSLYFFFLFYFNFRGLFCKSLISKIDILNKDYYYCSLAYHFKVVTLTVIV